MPSFEYEKAIGVLTSQGKFHIKLGLERVKEVLALIDNPQNKLKFAHVAGTNGKGSVCAMLSSVLKQCCNVGLFTSPHIYEYTERIKINDDEISQKDFAYNILKIIDISEKNQIHLTEFEIMTVAAFEYFAQKQVDIVVLETGLGGRLDATNIISNNICSVITNIDLDHTERLGDNIDSIAKEKAGIIKPNCPVVISSKNAGYEIVLKTAKDNNSQVILSENAPDYLVERLSLKGEYQAENLSLVLKAIEILNQKGFNISKKHIELGLSSVKHPCRFEYHPEYNLIIDGAHNPNGAKLLRECLDKNFANQRVQFVFGCLNNKDYKSMMNCLFTEKDEVYFYQFDNPNSCSKEELEAVCPYASNDFKNFKLNQNILTVVCGSFYMIKELTQKMGIK